MDHDLKNKIPITQKSITTLILAAGNIKSACNYQLSFHDPGFLNIGNTLSISEIKKKVCQKVVLVVNNKKEKIYDLYPYNNVDIIEIKNTHNITETIKKSLKYIKTNWCLINPITTIPINNKLQHPFIEFGSDMLPKENWASMILKEKSNPFFLSKLDKKSEGLMSYPFTGRILAKTKDIDSSIDKIKELEKNDLIFLAKFLYENYSINIKYTEWLDIGHLATYSITRASSISSRFFNNLVFDKNKNIIKKKSHNKKKIEEELFFYKTIPDEIKRYFPLLINYENNKKNISYEMEYISNPNLSEIYLFSKLGPNTIKKIISSIEKIFETFYDKKPFYIEKTDWLYSEKTNSRKNELEEIIKKDSFKFLKEIYNNDFNINNLKFPSLKKTFSSINQELLIFEKNSSLHIGHGDLCFNNILVDPLHGNLKLIDPKGQKHSFLKKYGLVNKFYDLAKLNHSIEGLYDSVVNNLFKVNIIDNRNINFQVYKPNEYETYNNYFRELISDKRIDYPLLRILTANLFLTMLPMHIDNKKKIVCLSLIGSILMSKYSMEKIIL